MNIPHILNTSNKKKQAEFKRLFSLYNHEISFLNQHIDEINAPAVEVLQHKISSVNVGVLVEDTSLHVDGHEIGIHVKYMMEEIEMGKYSGTKAVWQVLLGFANHDGLSYICQGIINGTLSKKAGDFEFGFAQYFIPDGSTETISQSRNDAFNARAHAINALIRKDFFLITPKKYDFTHYSLQ